MSDNVKASKAYDQAGMLETKRLMDLVNKHFVIPKSLRGEPPSLMEFYEAKRTRNSKE